MMKVSAKKKRNEFWMEDVADSALNPIVLGPRNRPGIVANFSNESYDRTEYMIWQKV